MSNINRELPAFPNSFTGGNGMTLRDYFAAKAMENVHTEYMRMLAEPALLTRDDYHNIAADAYTLADAMLRARTA